MFNSLLVHKKNFPICQDSQTRLPLFWNTRRTHVVCSWSVQQIGCLASSYSPLVINCILFRDLVMK